MTQREFEGRLLQVVEKALTLLQSQAPVRSGLLVSSIALKATAKGYELTINTDKAPHMVYTEEAWKSEQWKGRDNPNEGWFKLAAELIFRLIRAELGSGSYLGNKE